MTKEEIDDIKIEHCSEQGYWNITMFVVPKRGNSGKVPCYADLVEAAEDVIRKAKGARQGVVPVKRRGDGVVVKGRPRHNNPGQVPRHSRHGDCGHGGASQ